MGGRPWHSASWSSASLRRPKLYSTVMASISIPSFFRQGTVRVPIEPSPNIAIATRLPSGWGAGRCALGMRSVHCQRKLSLISSGVRRTGSLFIKPHIVKKKLQVCDTPSSVITAQGELTVIDFRQDEGCLLVRTWSSPRPNPAHLPGRRLSASAMAPGIDDDLRTYQCY